MSTVEFYLVSNMIGCIIEIMGEKGIFTEKQYTELKKSMKQSHDPKDTLEALENILSAIKKEKVGE
jgi:biotin synthase-related radical SAM superfamily protein